jgi:hypothetical protein
MFIFYHWSAVALPQSDYMQGGYPAHSHVPLQHLFSTLLRNLLERFAMVEEIGIRSDVGPDLVNTVAFLWRGRKPSIQVMRRLNIPM